MIAVAVTEIKTYFSSIEDELFKPMHVAMNHREHIRLIVKQHASDDYRDFIPSTRIIRWLRSWYTGLR